MLAATYSAPIEHVMTPFDQALLRERRQRLLAHARGRVLELGGSSGVNLRYYPAARVAEVVVVGAEAAAAARLARSAARVAVPVHVAAPEEVGDGFDTVVAVFTFSGRPDLDAELREVAGRLHGDGQLLFLDHSPRRPPGLTTELSRPIWRLAGTGFVPGRDLPSAMRRCGFVVLSVDRFGLPTLTLPLRSCVAGVARRQRPGGLAGARQEDVDR
jgi:SAM-dependent methyltransferase